MPFPVRLLHESEEVVLDLHPHWWFLARHTAALVGALVVGVLVLVNDLPTAADVAAGVLLLAAVVWFVQRYLAWSTTHFVVTTDRLIYRHGVLAKEGIEIPLERVNTVFFSQSVFERLLRAGDLVIESAGEMGRQSFSDVRRPSNVQNEIYRQIEANENRKFDRIGAGAERGGLSVVEQLEKLEDLRSRGVLDDDEFRAQKRRLLES